MASSPAATNLDVVDAIGMAMDDIDTPALLLDASVLELNIRRMADFTAKAKIGLRPHAKSHKTPLIAHKQMAAGAVGVCCQKVEEAEVMVAGGVPNILITNEVVGGIKVGRVAALAQHARITVAVDNHAAGEMLAAAAQKAGVTIDVVVEVDVGQGRCGVPPGEPAVNLAQKLTKLTSLRLRGLQGYQGALQHVQGYIARAQKARAANNRLMDTRALFESRGLPLDIVTGGGTGTYDTESAVRGMTDIQPGSYIFMDREYREIGGRTGPVFDDFECALTVLATVMSTPQVDRVVIDAGIKALSTDAGPASVITPSGWSYVPAGDEHGILTRSGEGPALRLGEKVRLLPGHCDTTVNLYDKFHVLRDARLEAIWLIAARGCVR